MYNKTMKTKILVLNTAGGKITCPRCQAMSKRTGEQCGAPAERGKRVCRFHGALYMLAMCPHCN